MAGLFLAFGLSLLGLFEIRLPSFLLNASAQGESKGGLVGVMFMALTLTITSFTCTFPVVGGLLVMAAKGNYLYPIIGLATFAAVLALPFFLLALSPGLLSKMPKSGDWMNAVKVVGGLVEIGAAFKFLNTAETAFVVPEEAISTPTRCWPSGSCWPWSAGSTCSACSGPTTTTTRSRSARAGSSPARLFLFLALFLAPALFGRPPQSGSGTQVVGLLPADAGDLKAPETSAAHGRRASTPRRPRRSNDPKQAEREQTAVHGVAWGMSYEAALERAKAENKPVLIDFTGVNCANCRLMEQSVLPAPGGRRRCSSEFVTVQLYTDRVPINSIPPEAREKLAEENLQLELKVANESRTRTTSCSAPTAPSSAPGAGRCRRWSSSSCCGTR